MESPLRGSIPDGTCLIETFGWRPGEGVRYADLHLARLARGAETLGYPLDRDAARAAMDMAGDDALRVRLTLDATGRIAVTTAPLPPNPPLWRVAVAATRVQSGDPWLRVKTTNRALYDATRAGLPQGVDEWLFLNERDKLCEGTITNLFVETADGQRLTPALGSGLLPGILRQTLLDAGWHEAVLTLDDLRDARWIWMGNALRGLISAQIVSIA